MQFEKWEYLFIWYGGEIECNFRILERADLSVSVVPAGVELININNSITVYHALC